MANKLTAQDVPEIVRQSDVTSKPVRDGRTNLKNKVNEVIDDLAAVSIGTTNAETTAARPYHINLKERLDNMNAAVSGGAVTVNAGDTTKVDVTEFIGNIDGIDVKVAATTSAAISACAANKHRVDIVAAQSDNTFTVITGAEKLKASENLVTPSIASTQHALAWLYIDETGSLDLTNNIFTITQDNAYGEELQLVSGGTLDEQGTPDLSVKVAAGEAVVNQQYVTWTETNVRGVTVPGSNTRLDWIVVNEWGVVYRVIGTAAASPDFPAIPADVLVLGALVIKSTTTDINRGTECFDFINANNPYLPNLYVNASYNASGLTNNNVIIDLPNGQYLTNTLECQGYVWIANNDNGGAVGSGTTLQVFSIGSPEPFYDNDTTYTLVNRQNGDGVTGSGGGGSGNVDGSVRIGNTGQAGQGAITIKAFNIYIKNCDISGGAGAAGIGLDQHDNDATWTDEGFYTGGAGGNGGAGNNVTLTAVDTIEILSGGTLDISGGAGTNGGDQSNGTIANIGGKGGTGGAGGDLTYTCKTYTNNGTFTQAGGAAGSGGTGSGGSDANGNGTAGSAGAAGSTTATLYDYTTGLPANYSDWLLPIRNEKIF